MNEAIEDQVRRHAQAVEAFLKDGGAAVLARMAEALIETLKTGRRVYLCGNGGSAADAQHIAGELVGRFERERRGLPVLALTTDTSILTAVGNDYGFETVFERQVEAFVREGDVLIGLSTSGNSPNVLRAVEAAKRLGARTLGFAGRDGGRLKERCDLCLVVPESRTCRVQEVHILAAHVLCDLVERGVFGDA